MDTSGTQRKMLALRDVRRIARDMLERWGAAGGRALPEPLAAELQRLDRDCDFSDRALAEFQGLLGRVGLATHRPIVVPVNDEPFWFRAGHPLAGYRSQAELPPMADVVIIGAGLTGAAAAYHLTDAVRGGASVVVLDRADPAGEASGRNGGNFELIPENSVGVYEGLARERLAFLHRCHPSLPREVLGTESERQASLVLGLALRNRELLKGIVMRERIDCDLMPRGWLHLASSEEEEQGLCDEVLLAAQHGQQIQLWSRGRIRHERVHERPLSRALGDSATSIADSSDRECAGSRAWSRGDVGRGTGLLQSTASRSPGRTCANSHGRWGRSRHA